MTARNGRTTALLAATLLAGCSGQGTWTLEVWGEEFVEEGIGTDVFADGCSVAFDRFLIVTSDRALLDDAGEPVVRLPGAEVWDLVPPGPHAAEPVTAPTGTWRGMRVTVAPVAEVTAGNAREEDVADLRAAGASLLVTGTLACPSGTVTFDWAFDSAATYDCDPENLVIAVGEDAVTQFTVHADHLFYDSLYDPDAAVRGEALVAADADEDGVLTKAELAAAPVAPTGYTVGAADVTDLWAYLTEASRSVGHVDGEGHCAVR